MTQDHEQRLPKSPEPYWREVSLPEFDSLNEDQSCDVVIVGGGITGITAAYLLVQEGQKVILLEASNLLNGTTGHTTAKITAQHGLIYDELINHFGKEKAQHYYEANRDALNFIKDTVQKNNIDCDFSEEDAYIYATSKKDEAKVEKEYEAYQKLGIDSEYVDKLPLDIKIKGAAVMKKQAQFHPVKYLKYMVDYIKDNGGVIYENTTAVDVEESDTQPKVVTRKGNRVQADHILACSHFPFYDGLGFYFSRLHADRSYILAAKMKEEYPGGMYISADQKHPRSLRYTPVNGEQLVLIGGDSHQTGQGADTLDHYQALQDYAEAVFEVEEYKYRWSAQDLISLDRVPYIGPIIDDNPNVSVATGYRKWGMTGGTAAALLLKDIVLDRDNPYRDVFSPSRFQADPSLRRFLKENGDVARHLIAGKFDSSALRLDDLSEDEGGVVLVNGRRVGAYKDDQGELHTVDTTCTHMGCEVEWNHGDRTWDCPCHGSRFSYKGEVIEGPAKRPIKPVDIKKSN